MIDSAMVIDFHGHVGAFEELLAFDDAEKMLRAMDAGGIDKSCLFNIFYPDGKRGNDLTADFVSRHPDRFIGFAYVSPLMPERMVPELERAIDQLGLRAIKLYPPYTPYPLNHPAWDPVYQFAHERELAVIAHTGLESASHPKFLGEAAPRFPGANFVAGHSGNSEPYRSQAIEAAQRCPNFYLETCSTFRTPGVIEELVEKGGAERVLFGSDIPLMDPRSQVGKIITADISDQDKRLVLGENARRLLKL
jgi:hypothetical protein